MKIELLDVKALFDNNKALIQGLREIHGKSPNLYSALTKTLWDKYIREDHGNEDEITLSLLSNEEWREQHISSFDVQPIPMCIFGSEWELEDRIGSSIINDEFLRGPSISEKRLSSSGSGTERNVQLCSTIGLFQRTPSKSGGPIREDELKFRQSLTQQYYYDEETPHIFSYLCGDYPFPECVEKFILNERGIEELYSGDWNRGYKLFCPMNLAFQIAKCTSNYQQMDDEDRTILNFDDIAKDTAKADYRKMLLQSPNLSDMVMSENDIAEVEKFFGAEDFLVDISTIQNVRKTEKNFRLLLKLKKLMSGIDTPLHDLFDGLWEKGVWNTFVKKVKPPLVDLIIEFKSNDSIFITEYLRELKTMMDHAKRKDFGNDEVKSVAEEENLRRIVEMFNLKERDDLHELKKLREFLRSSILSKSSSAVDMMISWTNVCIERGIDSNISKFNRNEFTNGRKENETTFDDYLLHSAKQILKQVRSKRRDIQ